MPPEVGHESGGVLKKSKFSEYQRRTYFDQSNLVIDKLDDINHRKYVVAIPFHQFGAMIFI